MRVLWVVICVAACGRLDFDARPDGGGTSGDGLRPDAPGLPSTICALNQLPIAGLPPIADLAIAATPTGFIAMWSDVTAGRVFALRLDDSLNVVVGPVEIDLGGMSATSVHGVADAGSTYIAQVATAVDQTTLVLAHPLPATPLSTVSTTSATVLRDPFPSDTARTPRVFLSSDGADLTNLRMTYVDMSGTFGAARNFSVAPNQLTEIAGDDGPDHGHIAWAERPPNGTPMCSASDIDFFGTPAMGSPQLLSTDCREIRNASGPDPADSMMIVWTTGARAVHAEYIASTGDLPRLLSMNGREPRARFDGTRFWLSWLDGNVGAETMMIATFDLSGNVSAQPLAGWTPSGPEAFELVRKGTDVYMVVLGTSELSILRTCP